MFGNNGHLNKEKNIVVFLLVDNLRTVGTAIVEFFGEPCGSMIHTFKHVLNHLSYVNCLSHVLMIMSEAPSDG